MGKKMGKTMEKVLAYLQDRKRSVAIETISHHYLLSTPSVYKALRDLENLGKVARDPAPAKAPPIRWFWRAASSPVAVSEAVNQPQPSRPPTIIPRPRPTQNSYPTVRGYDD